MKTLALKKNKKKPVGQYICQGGYQLEINRNLENNTRRKPREAAHKGFAPKKEILEIKDLTTQCENSGEKTNLHKNDAERRHTIIIIKTAQ